MPDIVIDTSSNQYQQLLAGLGTLRTVLAPRIRILLLLPRDKQLAWLKRDALLRRAIRMAQNLSDIIDMELDE